MTADDAFHRRLFQVTSTELSDLTAQSGGMRRLEALSGRTVGTSTLWMGQVHVAPAATSDDYHHGRVRERHLHRQRLPEFVFLEEVDDGWVE